MVSAKILSMFLLSALSMAVPLEDAAERGLTTGEISAPLVARLEALEKRFAAIDNGIGMSPLEVREAYAEAFGGMRVSTASYLFPLRSRNLLCLRKSTTSTVSQRRTRRKSTTARASTTRATRVTSTRVTVKRTAAASAATPPRRLNTTRASTASTPRVNTTRVTSTRASTSTKSTRSTRRKGTTRRRMRRKMTRRRTTRKTTRRRPMRRRRTTRRTTRCLWIGIDGFFHVTELCIFVDKRMRSHLVFSLSESKGRAAFLAEHLLSIAGVVLGGGIGRLGASRESRK